MLTKKLLAIAVLPLLALSAYGQSTTVTFTAAPGERDVTFGGLPVADGNYVRVGYFDPSFDVAGNAFNLSSLATAWHGLGFTTMRTLFSQPGRFSGNLSTADPAFSGNKICLWIFNTAGNGDPAAAAYANVLGYGLFSGTGPEWLFPSSASPPPGNMTTVTSTGVDQAYFGSFNGSHLILNPVPEPSTIVLLALASSGLFWFWRKNGRSSQQ